MTPPDPISRYRLIPFLLPARALTVKSAMQADKSGVIARQDSVRLTDLAHRYTQFVLLWETRQTDVGGY